MKSIWAKTFLAMVLVAGAGVFAYIKQTKPNSEVISALQVGNGDVALHYDVRNLKAEYIFTERNTKANTAQIQFEAEGLDSAYVGFIIFDLKNRADVLIGKDGKPDQSSLDAKRSFLNGIKDTWMTDFCGKGMMGLKEYKVQPFKNGAILTCDLGGHRTFAYGEVKEDGLSHMYLSTAIVITKKGRLDESSMAFAKASLEKIVDEMPLRLSVERLSK